MDLREVPHTLGERHPWERSRFRFFADALHEYARLGARQRILDVGAGDAWFADELARECDPACQITCWDVEYPDQPDGIDVASALGVATNRNLTLVRERPDIRFDIILALDVLEHVAEDRELLATLVADNLAPGGAVLISVPAWQALYSQHDAYLAHMRRYSPTMLRQLIASAGLEIAASGGLFHSLLVPRALTRVREIVTRRDPAHVDSTGHESALAWPHGPFVTRLVYTALRVDNRVSQLAARASISIPGLSLWAMCTPS